MKKIYNLGAWFNIQVNTFKSCQDRALPLLASDALLHVIGHRFCSLKVQLKLKIGLENHY